MIQVGIDKSCTLCQRHLTRVNTVVQPHYIDNMEGGKCLVCVSSYPKKDQAEIGHTIPESSAEYQLLAPKFNNVGFPIYLTDAVKCCDREESTPKTSDIAICKNAILLEEITRINPPVIIAFGYIAIRALFELPANRAKEYVNKKFKTTLQYKDKQWTGIIFTTFNPGYLVTMGNSAWYQKHEFDHIVNLAIKEVKNG